ncbi:MAG: RNA polymerase factor sigma-54 [Methylacidiphilales bacterium]|nr:RNA polymerase factor sigma-54 [Candidatus Methylacidiphilales bacterium]MDW8349297.1 RNA polymerase factor sigma-54 [Verrucomicrobiae bacterium]
MQNVGLSQSLSLSQQLSPQMQYSLRILQAQILELQSLVQKEINENPLLEDERLSETPSEDPSEEPPEPQLSPDYSWREYFSQSIPTKSFSSTANAESTDRHQQFLDAQSTETTLTEHLLRQLLIATPPPPIRKAAEEIIWNLDENGFLHVSLYDIAQSTKTDYETVQKALELVQSFEPAGVAARDLSESLALQLQRYHPNSKLEIQIVTHHLEALARRHYNEIARALNVSRKRVIQASKLIQKLNPHPASNYAPTPRFNIIYPEIEIEKINDQWVVTLLEDELPKIRINTTYKDLLAAQAHNPEIKEYLKEKLRSGQFLIKAIKLRQDTLRRIAERILHHQKAFFEKGPDHLAPLTMNQIAQELNIHETTVSRSIANKALRCPHGVFPLRHFFSTAVKTKTGESLANTTAKEIVAEIIKNEDPQNPLSDQEIYEKLSERGLVLARRTIAKYRKELGILPSHLRKQVA